MATQYSISWSSRIARCNAWWDAVSNMWSCKKFRTNIGYQTAEKCCIEQIISSTRRQTVTKIAFPVYHFRDEQQRKEHRPTEETCGQWDQSKPPVIQNKQFCVQSKTLKARGGNSTTPYLFYFGQEKKEGSWKLLAFYFGHERRGNGKGRKVAIRQ